MISGTFERLRWIRSQSQVSPVPPRRFSWNVSSRWKSVWKGSSACMSAPPPTRAALTICAPVRRRTSSQYAGPSSPCSCTIVSPSASTCPVTSSSGALTNTPQTSALRFSVRAISSAWSSSQARGDPGQRMRPTAQAPASTASSASGRPVMPQILMRVGSGTPPSWQIAREPYGVRALRGGRAARRVLRALCERHRDRPLLAGAAHQGDLHGVALALGGDRRREALARGDLLAVDVDDDVAAEADGRAVHLGGNVAALDARTSPRGCRAAPSRRARRR